MSVSKTKLLVAAIDFGTTYSGYAFSFLADYKDDPLKIAANNAWNAGGQCLLSLKTPTVLLYDPKAEKDKQISFGYEAQNTYITLASDDNKTLHKQVYYFSLFKMKLQGDKALKSNFEIEDETGKSMKALDVFKMSITWLKNHLMESLKTQGTGVEPDEVLWVLTVPAIWSDSAKKFMRQAAEAAGIKGDNLQIALEPEVASLFCQHLPVAKLAGTDGTKFTVSKPGTKYMVVDLGGGTADITVHEKLEDNKLKELWKASGGAWGGSAVNQQFLNFWTSIVGNKSITRFQTTCKEDYLEMLREFEVTKRSVDTKNTGKTTLKIPASLNEICLEINKKTIKEVVSSPTNPLQSDVSVVSDKMRVTAERMQTLFDPVVNGIIGHIEGILKKPAVQGVTMVLMVGGFSESAYIQEKIKQTLKKNKIKVIVPGEAGLAVLKGAVIFGHKPSAIQSRIIRYTYGVKVSPEFDETVHPASKKVTAEGKSRCSDVFSSFMIAGQSVEVGHKVIKVYSTIVPNQTSVKITIVSATDENPTFVTDTGCNSIGELEMTVPNPTEEDKSIYVTYVFGDTELHMIALAEQGTPCITSFKLE